MKTDAELLELARELRGSALSYKVDNLCDTVVALIARAQRAEKGRQEMFAAMRHLFPCQFMDAPNTCITKQYQAPYICRHCDLLYQFAADDLAAGADDDGK